MVTVRSLLNVHDSPSFLKMADFEVDFAEKYLKAFNTSVQYYLYASSKRSPTTPPAVGKVSARSVLS